MEAAPEALSRDLVKLRTGRVAIGMLLLLCLLVIFSLAVFTRYVVSWLSGMMDHIFVVRKNVKIPLNKMATVSMWNTNSGLVLTQYDPNVIVFIFTKVSYLFISWSFFLRLISWARIFATS